MTMLTPLGVEDRRGRVGRMIFRIVAVLVTLGVLAGAGLASWHYLVQDDPKAATKKTCPSTSARSSSATTAPARLPIVAASKIKVNVYNATTRRGLAGTVAAEMRKRRFGVLAVSNDPLNRPVTAAAEVRRGPRGVAAARTVAAQVGGSVILRADHRADASVDLVLGKAWTKPRTVAAAAAALKALPPPPKATTPATC